MVPDAHDDPQIRLKTPKRHNIGRWEHSQGTDIPVKVVPMTDSAKNDTRRKILRAASRQFARSGYEAASIHSICERANVAHGTVFWHFGSKSGLYLEVARDAGHRFVRAMRPHLERDSLSFGDLVETWVRYLSSHPELSSLLLAHRNATDSTRGQASQILNAHFLDFWHDAIRGLEERKQIPPVLNKDDIARLLVGAAAGLLTTSTANRVADALTPLTLFAAMLDGPIPPPRTAGHQSAGESDSPRMAVRRGARDSTVADPLPQGS